MINYVQRMQMFTHVPFRQRTSSAHKYFSASELSLMVEIMGNHCVSTHSALFLTSEVEINLFHVFELI